MSNKPSTAKPDDKEPSKASKSEPVTNIAKSDNKPGNTQAAAATAKSSDRKPSAKNTPVAVKSPPNKPGPNSNPPQTTSGSGSSIAVIAFLLSAVTAGGAFFLWKELTAVQHTVATTVGIEQSDLDALKQSLEQSIAHSTEKTATELQGTINETKGSLEKLIEQSTSEVASQTSSVQNDTQQSISSIESNLAETNASLQQNRSELEGVIALTKKELQEEFNQAIAASNAEIASMGQTLSSVESAFGELRQELTSAFDSLRQEVNDRLTSAEAAQASLQASVQASQAELTRAISRNRIDWAVAEVEHILRLANEQIQLEQNVAKAITTLRTADQRLKSLGDPVLLKVQEALEQDIASLAQVDVPDISSIALTLGQLANDAQKLTTIGSTDVTATSESKAEEEDINTTAEIVADNSLQAIKGFATAALQGFGSLVVVKKDDKTFAPVIPPSQAFFVRQNLQLKLETARIALLKQDNATFHDAIKTAISWTEQYFNGASATTKKFIADLSSLSTLNLAPALPDISGSLSALHEVQPTLLQ